MCNAARQVPLPRLREDELITGWPILAPSTHQDAVVLFKQQVTSQTEISK